MTKRTSAQVAGTTFLAYIVIGVSTMAIHNKSVDLLLGLATGFIALMLGVALYGLTHDEDAEVAMFGLLCRTAEAFCIVIPTLATLAIAKISPQSPIAEATELLRSVKSSNVILAATFFSAGSLAFCWLLYRGRIVPRGLAGIGLFASVLLIVVLPLQLVGLVTSKTANYAWIPMALFEVPVGFWLIGRGGRATV